MKTLTAPAPASAFFSTQFAFFRPLRRVLMVLHRRNPALSWAGWLHLGVAAVALLLLPFDDRIVTGLHVWLKPLKFSLSGVVYVWSLGWLLAALPVPAQRAVRRLSRLVAVSMVGEISAITLQAARGTTSHFNIGTPANALVFMAMGLLIVVNTVAVVWALALLLRYRPLGPAAYVWGMRLGVVLFLAGSVVGGVMSGHNAHTVGAPDGGPGLPGLGWSTRHGDLRIAHFLGLHALQLVPLLGWVLSRYVPGRAVLLTWVGAAVYAGLAAGLFGLAMGGRPL